VKELHGQASGEVQATTEQCFALLADVEGYPTWYPETVRRAEITQRDPTRAQVVLHVSHGPLTHDFDLEMDVRTHRPDSVELARAPHDPSDREQFEVSWQITSDGARTRLQLSLYANLSLPRLVPVGGVADGIAKSFVEAASRALAGASSSPAR
jgi:ribosome-associated toxin RatA of RatAB toxin-antitoxin module